MDLDTIDGWIYWTDVGTKQVQRARLDGTGVQDLLQAQHGLDQPYGVTLDPRNNFIYVTDAGTGNVLSRTTRQHGITGPDTAEWPAPIIPDRPRG
jgi:hypothetical protein